MPQRFDFRAFTLSLKDSQHRFIGMFCCLVVVADESHELVYESARDVKLPLRMTLRWRIEKNNSTRFTREAYGGVLRACSAGRDSKCSLA